MPKRRISKPLTEKEKEFYAGFKTVVNTLPAEMWAQNFHAAYHKAAVARFGNIIPNDPLALAKLGVELANQILLTVTCNQPF